MRIAAGLEVCWKAAKGPPPPATRNFWPHASVEVARKGSSGFGTYPSYDDFKSAVKSKADLGSNSYTTSWGGTVGANEECGLNFADECDFPFDRMETESSDGKLIDWSNSVMTVSKNGRTCDYNFNNWSYQGDC